MCKEVNFQSKRKKKIVYKTNKDETQIATRKKNPQNGKKKKFQSSTQIMSTGKVSIKNLQGKFFRKTRRYENQTR